MKLNRMIPMAIIGAATASLAACDTIWGYDTDPGYSGYYTSGIYNDWTTPFPGTPIVSPYYWGGQLYPGAPLPYPPLVGNPPTRPGTSVGPVVRPNRPSGNIRPGSSQSAGTPVTLPDNRPVPTETRPGIPNITGGEPGVAMPPSGVGIRPGRH